MNVATAHPVHNQPADYGVSRSQGSDTTISVVFYLSIIASMIYGLGFNYLPERVRLGFAAFYVLPPILAFFAVFINFGARNRTNVLALLGVFLLSAFVTMFTADHADDFLAYIPELLRDSLGFVLLSLVLFVQRLPSVPMRVILLLVCLVVAAASFVLAFTGPVVNLRGERLATITGGTDIDGLHPSAYFVGALCIIFDQLRRKRQGPRLILLGATAVMGGLILLYQVRTMQVALLYYFLLAYLASIHTEARRGIVALAVFVFPVATFAVFLVFDQLADVDLYTGSGRIGAYLDRYDIFMARDFVAQMFGSGPGTDMFVGERVWRYEAKGSHNDFITILIQNGVIGLTLAIAILLIIGRKIGEKGRVIFLPLLLCSLLSNGPLLRPAQIPLFTLALAIALWVRECPRQAPGPNSLRP